jgi:hypothetical protein
MLVRRFLLETHMRRAFYLLATVGCTLSFVDFWTDPSWAQSIVGKAMITLAIICFILSGLVEISGKPEQL